MQHALNTKADIRSLGLPAIYQHALCVGQLGGHTRGCAIA